LFRFLPNRSPMWSISQSGSLLGVYEQLWSSPGQCNRKSRPGIVSRSTRIPGIENPGSLLFRILFPAPNISAIQAELQPGKITMKYRMVHNNHHVLTRILLSPTSKKSIPLYRPSREIHICIMMQIFFKRGIMRNMKYAWHQPNDYGNWNQRGIERKPRCPPMSLFLIRFLIIHSMYHCIMLR
jgi:hypothetical protein